MVRFAGNEVPTKLPGALNSGVYQICNTENGRIYIGSAMRVGKRWREHVRGLRAGNHHSRFMQRCWNKSGDEAFEFSLLIACAPDDLLFYEQRALDAIKPEYNSAPKAGSQLGYRHRSESREQMRKSRALNPTSWMKGRTHSEATRAMISASRKGKGGGPRSPERLAKISAALTGKSIPQVVRDKIAAKLRGHKQSREQIQSRMNNMPAGHYERIAMEKSKLDDDSVRVIRNRLASGEAQVSVARDFGVSQGTVSRISLGRSYGWVAP